MARSPHSTRQPLATSPIWAEKTPEVDRSEKETLAPDLPAEIPPRKAGASCFMLRAPGDEFTMTTPEGSLNLALNVEVYVGNRRRSNLISGPGGTTEEGDRGSLREEEDDKVRGSARLQIVAERRRTTPNRREGIFYCLRPFLTKTRLPSRAGETP